MVAYLIVIRKFSLFSSFEDMRLTAPVLHITLSCSDRSPEGSQRPKGGTDSYEQV